MSFHRHSLLVALLVLLSACGDATQAPPATPEAAVAPPVQAEVAAMAEAVASAGDEAYTVYKRACLACHGDTAEGVGDFPSLAKLSVKEVGDRLRAYRAGDTVGPRSALMTTIAQPLSDEQIAALALYLGS